MSTANQSVAEPRSAAPPRLPHVRLISAMSFRRVGALYVWLLIIAIFCIWVPHTFPTTTTIKQVLNDNAVTGLLGLSLIVPLSAGVFDLSGATTMSLTGVIVTKLIAGGMPLAPAIAVTMCAALAVGVLNAVVVIGMGIDSFIGTLATGSVIQAFISIVTGDLTINSPRLGGPFAGLGDISLAGVTLPVFFMLAMAVVIWFVQRKTATGRRLYAIGFNADSSRLAGLRVDHLRIGSLLVSSSFAGLAGILLASVLQSGTPTAGSSYLLPGFAAVFLGATQISPGRFNAVGTIIAVLLLGTGITGLGLASAPGWSEDMFTGVVLIAALAITGAERKIVLRRPRRMGSARARPPEPTSAGLAPDPVGRDQGPQEATTT